MKGYLIILFFLMLIGKLFCQEPARPEIFNSPFNIKIFADDLFCRHDYQRGALEYERYLSLNENDTARYKLALSLMKLEKFSEAALHFKNVPASSMYFKAAEAGLCKSSFLVEDYNSLRKINSDPANKLLSFSSLIPSGNAALAENEYLKPFDEADKTLLKKFYEQKKNPGYASPLKAALLSAIIPGLGKIYARETSDGIMSALITGLFGFLAYDNLHANHQFRGYLFSGLGLFFYASNIYGSAAQAEIYNSKVDFNFNLELKSFLELKNYFLPPEPEFCR